MRRIKLSGLIGKSPFTHHPTKCCCCLPLRSGIFIIALILMLHGAWNALSYFTGVNAYDIHMARGTEIFYGFLFLMVIPVGIFGIYVSRMKNAQLAHKYVRLYWGSIGLLLILHFVDMVLAFVWRNDITTECQKNLIYLVPANTSTTTVPFDPNAPTSQQINNACERAMLLSLVYIVFEYIFLRIILLTYFCLVVYEYSQKLVRNTDQDVQKADIEAKPEEAASDRKENPTPKEKEEHMSEEKEEHMSKEEEKEKPTTDDKENP